jgi:hypothetical protein
MAALQLLAIAGYCASLRPALQHQKRNLHTAQLIFLVLLCHIYPVVYPEKWYNFAMSTSVKISKGMYLKIPPKHNPTQRDSI